MGPFISVVIATFNRSDLIINCIESVLAGDYIDFEIIIVDQGKDDKTKRAIEERFGKEKHLRYFHTDVIGLSHARNFGYEKARGEIIVYIDDDAVASPYWLNAYASAFTKISPVPGMVGGKILPAWEVPCPSWYPEKRRFLLGIYDIGDEVREFPQNALPPGANFAMSRTVINKLGGFDRRLGFDEGRKKSMIAGEDSLMAQRVKEAGYAIYYHPGAEVHHFIAKYKLTKKYYLKRHYWEGRTVITVMALKNSLSSSKLWAVLLWHVRSSLRRGMVLAVTLPKVFGNHPEGMLQLGLLFYSLGVCIETGNLLIKRYG